MKFAEPYFLFGTAVALAVAILLVVGGLLLVKGVRRFGDEALVLGLVTGRPGGRRALKGSLLVLALALSFAALAQPQYGRGTRLIPATNLDVVIVLDYSKSMYARDVKPSRSERAKAEVARLIGDLPGARFAAVVFAGEPMAFPLTSDGGAIAQFFRQLTPNDLPVGGTAIGRALEAARELFLRDPLSEKHEKVILLVTDGEDLEGDPVSVARAAAAQKVAIHVVQIGGRTPEPIPEVNELGQVTGWRTDEEGKPLTTSLSAAGEAQLAEIAKATGGSIVQSKTGQTGLDLVAARLRRLMTEELSERVETVYADVYMYPLALAVLLLFLEAFVNETKPRARAIVLPPPPPRRKRRRRRALPAAVPAALLFALALGACSKSRSPFERYAPAVDDAIGALEAVDAGAAVDLLTEYLSTGKCEKGEIGLPDRVGERPNASFDLGLGLFQLAERFGRRFGEEESGSDAGPSEAEKQAAERRASGVDCALRIVRSIAADATQPAEFRARAHYLAGNLEFLNRDYATAVKSYDAALKIVPGLSVERSAHRAAAANDVDAGDGIGRDAAHNRAVALRRIEDDRPDAEPPDAGPPDAEPDAEPPEPDAGEPDAGPQDAGPPDAGEPDAGDQDEKADAGQEQPQDGDQGPDAGPPDAGQKPEPKPQPQPQSASQDERILDELERAPTLQEQNAKDRALGRRGSGMEDK